MSALFTNCLFERRILQKLICIIRKGSLRIITKKKIPSNFQDSTYQQKEDISHLFQLFKYNMTVKLCMLINFFRYKSFNLKKNKRKLGNCLTAALLHINPLKVSQASWILGCSQNQKTKQLFTRLSHVLDIRCVSSTNNIVEICAFLTHKYKELHQYFTDLAATTSNTCYLN